MDGWVRSRIAVLVRVRRADPPHHSGERNLARLLPIDMRVSCLRPLPCIVLAACPNWPLLTRGVCAQVALGNLLWRIPKYRAQAFIVLTILCLTSQLVFKPFRAHNDNVAEIISLICLSSTAPSNCFRIRSLAPDLVVRPLAVISVLTMDVIANSATDVPLPIAVLVTIVSTQTLTTSHPFAGMCSS